MVPVLQVLAKKKCSGSFQQNEMCFRGVLKSIPAIQKTIYKKYTFKDYKIQYCNTKGTRRNIIQENVKKNYIYLKL